MEGAGSRAAVPVENQTRAVSVALCLAAAFGWATYYLFVLWVTPGTSPSAIIVLPFAVGGATYSAWAVLRGHARAFARTWTEPAAYLRTSLLLGMQLAVLASTYLTGPVDTSLLTLIGDVVVTPLVAVWLVGQYRASVGTPLFAAGLLLSLAGGALAVLGGRRLSPVADVGWAAVVAVPLTVAFFFFLSARAGEGRPSAAVVAPSMLTAAAAGLLVAPWLPGGEAGVFHVAPLPLVVLVATGLTSFFLSPVLYFHAIDRLGLVLPPTLLTAIPVFTLLLSALVLGLELPPLAILGVPVAAVGGILAIRAYAAGPPPATDPGGSGRR